MIRSRARLAVAFGCGLLFGLGLVVSGMTDPARVRAFLNIAGPWDPSLLFVLIGAVATALIGFRWLRVTGAPWCGDRFEFPEPRRVDAQLLEGAALFGVGWGLVGLCPGPAIVDLATGSISVVLFVAAMLAGMAVHAVLRRLRVPYD